MPSLKPSELRLLVLFGVLIFLAGNYLLYSMVVEQKAVLVQQATTADAEVFRLQQMLKERDRWTEVRDWVEQNLRPYPSIDERDTFLIKLMRQRTNQTGVEVKSGPDPFPAEIGPFYEETKINAVITGGIEETVRFLYSLQEPNEFRSITSLTMTPVKNDQTIVQTEFTLVQWWASDSLALVGQTAPAPAHPVAEPLPAPGAPITPSPDLEAPEEDAPDAAMISEQDAESAVEAGENADTPAAESEDADPSSESSRSVILPPTAPPPSEETSPPPAGSID